MFHFDGTAPVSAEALQGVTHILHSIPPKEEGDRVFALHADMLAALPSLRWFGYLSATSVYGDTQGGWVDEEAATEPPTTRGKRRVAAEQAWLSSGLPVHIFRLAGIYGPGRNVLAELLRGKGRRIFKEGQVFSRIHVEDIVRVLHASILKPDIGAIYNLADNLPAPAWEVVEYAAHLLGCMPPPLIPLEEAELSPMARSFYEASRRVSNRRIREELKVELDYPDYRRGLQSLLEEEKARYLQENSQ